MRKQKGRGEGGGEQTDGVRRKIGGPIHTLWGQKDALNPKLPFCLWRPGVEPDYPRPENESHYHCAISSPQGKGVPKIQKM